ncbi:hypothetical protein NECAME_01966 [Necator americanus]|uniref:CBM20 domain-containing protein n=1 Tax=Necator americanus TaxID=51031 RepID=W2TNH7_NECAM|nr:hypothetical protein NECAME_01966 [Necator americanus]ETN82681.1 hypothetical protein NECAME_01966 [Necator americanus]
MMEKTRVSFRVRALRLKLWEKVFVCGSDASLGEWDPIKALPLTKSLTDSDVWTGTAEISETAEELKYRYMVGYYLDSCTEGSKQMLIVHRYDRFHFLINFYGFGEHRQAYICMYLIMYLKSTHLEPVQ